VKFTKVFVLDLVERSVSTFVQAFLALWLAGGDIAANALFTWGHTKIALVAGVLAVAKSVLASFKGDPNSASLVDLAVQGVPVVASLDAAPTVVVPPVDVKSDVKKIVANSVPASVVPVEQIVVDAVDSKIPDLTLADPNSKIPPLA